jgi:VanZ family protein
MSKTTLFLRRWGPALLMMAVIFAFSSVPSNKLPNFDWADLIVKKGGHALGYGLLALSYLHGLKGNGQDDRSRWFYIAWAMAILYSATDEFHQSFVPGRHPEVTDVMIDAIGAAIMLFLFNQHGKKTTSGTGWSQTSEH